MKTINRKFKIIYPPQNLLDVQLIPALQIHKSLVGYLFLWFCIFKLQHTFNWKLAWADLPGESLRKARRGHINAHRSTQPQHQCRHFTPSLNLSSISHIGLISHHRSSSERLTGNVPSDLVLANLSSHVRDQGANRAEPTAAWQGRLILLRVPFAFHQRPNSWCRN